MKVGNNMGWKDTETDIEEQTDIVQPTVKSSWRDTETETDATNKEVAPNEDYSGTLGKVGSTLVGAAQGITGNLVPQITGAIGAVTDPIAALAASVTSGQMIEPKSMGEAYAETRDRTAESVNNAEEQNPTLYGAGEVAGVVGNVANIAGPAKGFLKSGLEQVATSPKLAMAGEFGTKLISEAGERLLGPTAGAFLKTPVGKVAGGLVAVKAHPAAAALYAIKPTQWAAGKIVTYAEKAPQIFGKYSNVMSAAAARGSSAVATTHFLLSQSDPEYREKMKELEEKQDNE